MPVAREMPESLQGPSQERGASKSNPGTGSREEKKRNVKKRSWNVKIREDQGQNKTAKPTALARIIFENTRTVILDTGLISYTIHIGTW